MGVPIQRLKKETTSKDFSRWKIYLRQRINTPQKIDHYLAQISSEVRRSYVKSGTKICSDDFLIKYQYSKRSKTKDEDRFEKKNAMSKAFWLTTLGVKKDG